ncbi:hypothetical protein ABH14_16540 [Brevibacillus brevis]|nr:hypothetical protein [Brevibacillus brevis]
MGKGAKLNALLLLHVTHVSIFADIYDLRRLWDLFDSAAECAKFHAYFGKLSRTLMEDTSEKGGSCSRWR